MAADKQTWFAAAYNTALVRYLGFMDSYLAGAELCHPSSNLGAFLAATEHAGGSGKDFLPVLRSPLQVEAVFTAAAPFMARGFLLTTQLTYSLGAGLSKALGLDARKNGVMRRDLRNTAFRLSCGPLDLRNGRASRRSLPSGVSTGRCWRPAA